MPRALVFGGRSGLLGQALVHVLRGAAWDVACLGREDGDLLDMGWLSKTVETLAPDVIFNATGWTQVDDAEDHAEAAMRWNRALPANLGRIVKGTSVFLVHYSTDFVFSGNLGRPCTEDDTPDPASVYGQSKLAGEAALADIAPQHSCILRTAWLFGPGRKNFVTTILDACRKRDSIQVVHDQTGSPTYSRDVAQWSMLLATQRATGIFHAVNGGRASWCEFACEAVTLAEAPCRIDPITSAEWPQKAKRPGFSVLATDRLAQTLGVSVRPWPQALREYMYQENLVSCHV